MTFLFLYPNLSVLGGIETLIARMGRALVDLGHEVLLLVEFCGEEKRLLPPEVKVVELGSDYEKLFFRSSISSLWDRYALQVPDIVKAFDAKSTWPAVVIASALTPAPGILVGIYGGTGFLFPRRHLFRNAFWRFMHWSLVECVPAPGRLFVSPDELEEFRLTFGTEHDGIIWHLPVDGKRYADVQLRPKQGHIVSIGRLGPMKEYVFPLVSAGRRLREKGLPITMSIYGDGPFELRLAQHVVDEKMGDVVALKGRIDHADFADAIEDAHVFVGMGTAIIEAAFAGVPSIVAPAHDRSGASLGPVYCLPPGALGGAVVSQPDTTIERELERIMRLTPSAYAEEQRLVREHARHFDVGKQMQAFLRHCANAPRARRRRLLEWTFSLYARLWHPKLLAGRY